MAAPIKIFRGDTFEGKITLRLLDSCDQQKQDYFVIPSGATIQVFLPGIPPAAAVLLSTATVGEITLLNAAEGTFKYKGSPIKSALLNKGSNQAITTVITALDGTVTTFQVEKILTVLDRANS